MYPVGVGHGVPSCVLVLASLGNLATCLSRQTRQVGVPLVFSEGLCPLLLIHTVLLQL